MKQTPKSDRSDYRSCRINSGSTPDRSLDWTPDSIGAPECSGFNRSSGVLRIQSEFRRTPDSIGVLRSSGVESGILSDSESVFSMWIRSGFLQMDHVRDLARIGQKMLRTAQP
uniref:Uncharacterized protein n=1 Tax=Anopheles maculatus TaxID=74869 RepID=A0A182T451_9DIPT